MKYIHFLFIQIALGTNIFIDLAHQISNSTRNGSPTYPYSNLTEALQSVNLAGNNNISDVVFILVKSATSYIFFDELTINFNLTITTEFKYNFYILNWEILIFLIFSKQKNRDSQAISIQKGFLNFSNEYQLTLENIHLIFTKNEFQNDFYIQVSQGFSLEIKVKFTFFQ